MIVFYILALLAEIVGTVGGFGSSLFFVPLAIHFFGFHRALGITAMLHLFSNVSKIALFREGIDWMPVYKNRRAEYLPGHCRCLAVALHSGRNSHVRTGYIYVSVCRISAAAAGLLPFSRRIPTRLWGEGLRALWRVWSAQAGQSAV